MKTNKLIQRMILSFVVMIFFASKFLMAQVELSGFFDLQYQYKLNQSDKSGLNFGQFLIGLEKSLHDHLSIEAGIAFNNESQQFEIDEGFVDFRLLGDEESHETKSSILNESGIIIGQFDIPFGIDYKCIPSPDRKLVTGPLANEKTINCWNNYGINIYGSMDFVNFAFFGVNGFSDGISLGGRIGLLPFEKAEFGISYMNDFKRFDNSLSNAVGGDFKVQLDGMEIKGEYVKANRLFEGEYDISGGINSGYYFQVNKQLNDLFNIPMFVIIRYGEWNSKMDLNENNGDDFVNRLTFGLGYEVYDNTEIRMEYLTDQFEQESKGNLLTAQLVISF